MPIWFWKRKSVKPQESGAPAPYIIRDVGDKDYFVLDGGAEGSRSSERIKFRDVITVIPSLSGNSYKEAPYKLLSIRKPTSNDDDDEKSHFELYSYGIDALPPTFPKHYMVDQLPGHLSLITATYPRRKIHVMVSVRSGTCEAEEFFDKIVQPTLKALGLVPGSYEVHYTTSDSTITTFASTHLNAVANAGVPQTVVLLSGDGGMVDIINGLITTPHTTDYVKPTIGLLVLGTGNALANSSGLNQNSHTKGLRTLLQGKPVPVPTFVAKFSPGSALLVDEARKNLPLPTLDSTAVGILHGAVVCSWGLHASLVADSDTEEYRKFGSERFQMAAKELLTPSDGSSSHAYRGKVTVFGSDGSSKQLDRTEYMYMLATLVSNLEATFRISPASKPLDGKLRLVHFGVLDPSEVMRILGGAFDGGKHVDDDAVGYEVVEGLRIDFEESDAKWRRVCVDGKIIVVSEGGWVEIRRESKEVVDLVIDR